MSSMWENAISNHPLFECCRSICRKWVIGQCIGQGWDHRNGVFPNSSVHACVHLQDDVCVNVCVRMVHTYMYE